ncbi:helix-turn-helix domain-containing protein [Aquamicrobium soli]|uniref:Helix-turn-helix domain-containing protein n=1 Tax=Aquamicrobium soli TaxID=1811518 RepID=A0ABV7KCR1_9HYPH
MDNHHTAVWAAIDRIAEHRGLTPSGLARMAGLDKTAFNLSKRTSRYGNRWPSTETIAAVIDAVGMTWAEFGRLVDGG